MKYNIEIAKARFNERGYILDEDVYINNLTKMKCHDKEGYKYLINMNSIRVNACVRRFDKSNPYSIENIQHFLDLESDGTKLIDNVYNGNKVKMRFKCSCGAEFCTTTNELLSGKKVYCEFCMRSRHFDGLIDYNSIVKEECKKRGYILITPNITRSRQKIEYICLKHMERGIQHTNYDVLINRGHGCLGCGSIVSGEKRRIDINKAIELTEGHGFEYVGYYYGKIYNSLTSMLIIKYICKNHRDKGIQITSYNEMKNRGFGCPFCKISRNEKIVEEILDKNDIKYYEQYRFDDCVDNRCLPFDFFLPEKNALIEVDGEGHYYPVNFGGTQEDAIRKYETCVKHDQMKNEYCEKNNITLIRLPYYIIKDESIDLEEYLLERI